MNGGGSSASRLLDPRMRSQLSDQMMGMGGGGGLHPHHQVYSSSRRLEVVSKQATKVTAISTKLEWRIDQFEKLMKLFKNGHNLISKQFACPQAPTVIWELHVYPNGKREEDNNNVSFFLRQVGLQRGEEPIMTEFQIYTLDSTNCRISICRDTKDFSNQQGRGKFQVQREKMLQALRADGSLLLICEVEYLPPGSKICVEQDDDADLIEEGMRGELSVRDALREMLDSELLADCTIQVGNKSMMAHRCILGQHSPVFRSMFNQKSMLEAQNGVIHITDSRPEPIRAMLDYIYTGSIGHQLMEAFAQGILAIADKYAVIPLKEHCERYLASSISKKNVASMAIIADTYFASSLKRACTRFISTNHKAIIRSPEWKELKSQRSTLANELLESVLDEQTPTDQNGESDDSIMLTSSSTSGLNPNGGLSSSIEGSSSMTTVFTSSSSAYAGMSSGHGVAGGHSYGGYSGRGRQESMAMVGSGHQQQAQSSGSSSEMASVSAPSSSSSSYQQPPQPQQQSARHNNRQASPIRAEQANPIRKRLRRGKEPPNS